MGSSWLKKIIELSVEAEYVIYSLFWVLVAALIVCWLFEFLLNFNPERGDE